MRKRSRWFMGFVLASALLATGAVANAGDGNSVKLSARLQGSQEVPPADLDARGKAEVRINVRAGTVCFDVKFGRVGTPNRGHIHKAPAGANGDGARPAPSGGVVQPEGVCSYREPNPG